MKKNHVTALYQRVKNELHLSVRHGHIYQLNDRNYTRIPEFDLPIMIRKLFPSEEMENISTGDVKEVIQRIIQDPELQDTFVDDTDDRYVNLQGGVFDAETGKMDTELAEDKSRKFSYALDFNYIEPDKRKSESFDEWVESSFPNDCQTKKKELLQILGYCISSYTSAKTGFFFVGESNSGKSTILELLRKIMPKDLVTAIPLYRLDNRFNMARLADSRLNISTEISEKSFIAADMYKVLTSNEIVTAEHKGQKPFEFRIRCKTINAGNILPNLDNLDGMDAILNRMTLLLFPVSIPKEDQDMRLFDKLWGERDSIFSEALDELHGLTQNNFVFVEPEDSKKLKEQMRARSTCFQDFIIERCARGENDKVHFTTLYEEFKAYCEDNLIEINLTKSQFSQRVVQLPGVIRDKFRINKSRPYYGVKGLGLKDRVEYPPQDSQTYSQKTPPYEKARNDGTLEQSKEESDI